jgi:hypothetical protein
MKEEEYKKLKREVETAKAEAERAAGAKQQLLAQLKQEWGCGSIEEAENKLAALRKKRVEAEAEFERLLQDYKAKYE